MLYILAIIMGFFLGCGFTLKFKSNPKETKPKYLRRGIYNHQFEAVDKSGNSNDVHVQFEIGEIERTSAKSKIEVIEVIPSQSEYSNDGYKKTMIKLINYTWIDSNSFEWIEDNVSEKRNQKIDEILS